MKMLTEDEVRLKVGRRITVLRYQSKINENITSIFYNCLPNIHVQSSHFPNSDPSALTSCQADVSDSAYVDVVCKTR